MGQEERRDFVKDLVVLGEELEQWAHKIHGQINREEVGGGGRNGKREVEVRTR